MLKLPFICKFLVICGLSFLNGSLLILNAVAWLAYTKTTSCQNSIIEWRCHLDGFTKHWRNRRPRCEMHAGRMARDWQWDTGESLIQAQLHKGIIRMKRLTASEITPAGGSTSLHCNPGLQQTTTRCKHAPLMTDQSHLPTWGVQINSVNELLPGKTDTSVWHRKDNVCNTCRQLCSADDWSFLGFPLICYSFMPMQLCKGGCLPPMGTSQRDLFVNPWEKKKSN